MNTRWTIGLFAQHNPLIDMGRNFRAGSERHSFNELAILVLVLVSIGVVIWLLGRYFNTQDRVGYTNPRKLFSELCYAHHLDGRARRLLLQLARYHRMKQPALLFLMPHQFDTNALRAMPVEQRDRLKPLYNKLFGNMTGTNEDNSSE